MMAALTDGGGPLIQTINKKMCNQAVFFVISDNNFIITTAKDMCSL